jgi:protein TonB
LEEPRPDPPAEPTPFPAAAPAPVRVAERAPAPPPQPVRVSEGALVTLEEVDSPPRLVGVVKPVYPPLARKARVGGLVLLRVLVSEKGAPQQVEVVRRAPAGLTESALDAVRKWTFAPATKGGVAVRTWLTVPIPFEP